MTNNKESFRWRVSLNETTTDSSEEDFAVVPQDVVDSYRQDGFVVCPHVLGQDDVDLLNNRLEEVLRGRYDRERKPDKFPRLIRGELRNPNTQQRPKQGVGPLGFSGNLQNVRVLQLINVHKCDCAFRRLATDRRLGQLVAALAGWKDGARLAQDQVWAKPPGAPPLVFHRDSPYFMFDPPDVVTVWVALDTMDAELGPLEYVKGSHRWGDGRVGSANQFFQTDGGRSLLKSAAAREGIRVSNDNDDEDDDENGLDIVSMAGLGAGGISIHDGRTWHGSGKNNSTTRPRRGLGLHFVPAQVRFTQDARKSRLWRPFVEHVDDATEAQLLEEDFPLVWTPS